MARYKITIEKSKAPSPALQSLYETAQFDEDGAVSHLLGFEYVAAYQVLRLSVNIEPHIPDRARDRVIRLALRRCIQQHQQQGSMPTLQSFAKQIDEVLVQFEEERATRTVLMFSNVSPRVFRSWEQSEVEGLAVEFLQ